MKIPSRDIHKTSSLSTVTPEKDDILIDTTKAVVVIGDGSTKGGIPLAKESLAFSYIDPTHYYPGTAWDDLRFPLTGQQIDTAAGRLDYDYFNGAVGFNANALYPSDPVSMVAQIEHKTKFTTLRPHIHWLQISEDVPNWLLAYKVIENGTATTKETDFSNHTFSIIQSHAFTYTSGNLPQISLFENIDISSLSVSDYVHFVLFRDSGNDSEEFAGADPSSSAELIYEFDCHYEIDSAGSGSEYIK